MAEAAIEPIGWERALMAAEKVKERLRRATRALDAAGVLYGKDFYLGGYHGWPYWERELHWALPRIVPLIERAER